MFLWLLQRRNGNETFLFSHTLNRIYSLKKIRWAPTKTATASVLQFLLSLAKEEEKNTADVHMCNGRIYIHI